MFNYTDDEPLIYNHSNRSAISSQSALHSSLWKPMKIYTKFIYKCPFLFLILIPLLTIGLLLVLILVQGVSVSADINNYRWEGDDITQRWDAYVGAAQKTYNSILGLLGESITMPRGFQMGQMGAIAYERVGKNILEEECLREIWKVETQMHNTSGWGDFCFRVPVSELPNGIKDIAKDYLKSLNLTIAMLEEDTNCIGFKTMLLEYQDFMQRTYNLSSIKAEDITNENFSLYLATYRERIVQTYLGLDFDYDKNTTSYLRSVILFGFPVAGYKNIADRKPEQRDIIGRFQLKMLEPLFEMNKRSPNGVLGYNALVYSMNIQISRKGLQQCLWLIGCFGFLFPFAIIVQRNFFTSILGVIGVFFPIPCSIVILQGVFGIHYLDIIYIIGLFLICGIGADCVFILFELFRQSRALCGNDPELRLAFAGQKALVALATSLLTSGISFLSLLSSGVRVMNFFGLLCFILLFLTFCFSFTWYISVLALWCKYFEPAIEEPSPSQSDIQFQNIPYPDNGLFDFFKKSPRYGFDSAGLPIAKYKAYERFFYNKVSVFIYFYRFPIVMIATALTIVFGILTLRMETKNYFQFLKSTDPLQKAYDLCNSKYHNVLETYDFSYVWGVEPKTTVTFKERLTIDQYGNSSWAPLNFTDPEVQLHINWTWDLINKQDFIDSFMTQGMGCNPISLWETIFNFTKKIQDYLWILEPFVPDIKNLLPTDYPINQTQYALLGWVWQILLSTFAFDDSDPYIRGTGKSGMMGFSNIDYSLKYIGMRASMKIPKEQTLQAKLDLYHKAMELEEIIENHSPPGLKGFHCSESWLKMVTEQKMPKQIVIDVIVAFSCATLVILISTRKLSYTILVVFSMFATLFSVLGILYLTGWKIGTNEAIMISIASGFCSDFIIQPMLAMAYDQTSRSLFGKIQASLTTFAAPVSSALITTLAAASFLYPCAVVLFTPFATFLLGSGLFGFLYGFVVLPALIAFCDSFCICKKRRNSDQASNNSLSIVE